MNPDFDQTAPEAEIQTNAETQTDIQTESGTQNQEPAPDEEQKERKRKYDAESRIHQLIRREAKANARAEMAERQLAQATQFQPQRPDFDGYMQQQEDRPLTREEMHREFEAYKAQEAEAERSNRVQSKLKAAIKADPDFADALESSDVEFNPQQLHVFADALDNSDNGPALIRYIATTDGEADRLSALSPLALSRELGRIEARLPSLTKPKASNAPAPLSAVRASSSPGAPSEKDTEAWIAWRNKQVLEAKR